MLRNLNKFTKKLFIELFFVLRLSDLLFIINRKLHIIIITLNSNNLIKSNYRET